ncbi:MAG: hypothetical protein Q9180_000039 [Flavoplaca navasiana]
MLRTLTRWPSMSTFIAKPRVVVVAGTTGVGKSELAVTLAEKFNGEIINGDALQLYNGLPIATNKLPVPEQRSIPHHLLGCIGLEEETWTVGKYVHSATLVIEDVVARGKLPILVGGTHYYTQSLLFDDSLVKAGPGGDLSAEAQEKKWPILAASTNEMLEELRLVDPEIAARWHPNDRRKIRHSLEVYLTTGRRPSDLYDEQQSARSRHTPARDTASELVSQEAEVPTQSTSPPRYNPLILWIYAELDQLIPRLDRRVDQMVDTGLIEEAQSLHAQMRALERSGTLVDQSKGIWTAIGYKELLPYLWACTGAGPTARMAEELKRQAIELTKIATRQYAKQQQRWIRGKLLRALEENAALDKLTVLDGTELSQWPQNVEATAVDTLDAFLKGNPLPNSTLPPTLSNDILAPKAKGEIKARPCQVCNIIMMTQQEWDAHPRSKKHRKATRTPIDWQALYPKARRQDNRPHHDDR